MKKPVFAVLILLVIALAAAFRLPQLEDRPMHADEAVQAARFRQLWQRGGYRYDPHEFHGPTLAYATLPSIWIAGANDFSQTTETTYRIVTALFGICLILWLAFSSQVLGRPAALCAGVLAAISPSMVFYSRYYIHETLLVFFSLAALATGWRYVRTGRLVWCLAAGASVGLMQATKETAVLAYAAAAVASGVILLRWRSHESSLNLARWRWSHLAWGAATAFVVAVLFYSSFGGNPRGPLDSVLTYFPWLGRAGGASPHIHPWYFYLSRLGWWRLADGPRWSEGLILGLAMVGLGIVWVGPRRLLSGADHWALRWLSLYTVVLALIYTVIPYKTPWCLLQFSIGLVLLAGTGTIGLVRATPTIALKSLVALVLLALGGQLSWQSYRAAYLMPADPRNPYVYAHTSPDAKRLASDIDQLIVAVPADTATPIKIVWTGDYYWPLPWYLRNVSSVEYWNHVPSNVQSPLILSSPEFDAELTEQLEETHLMTGYYGIRPGVLSQLWVREDVWEAHLRRLGRL